MFIYTVNGFALHSAHKVCFCQFLLSCIRNQSGKLFIGVNMFCNFQFAFQLKNATTFCFWFFKNSFKPTEIFRFNNVKPWKHQTLKVLRHRHAARNAWLTSSSNDLKSSTTFFYKLRVFYSKHWNDYLICYDDLSMCNCERLFRQSGLWVQSTFGSKCYWPFTYGIFQ